MKIINLCNSENNSAKLEFNQFQVITSTETVISKKLLKEFIYQFYTSNKFGNMRHVID